MESRRAKLDRTLLSCISRLESIEECCGIEHSLEEFGECSLIDFATWEKKNAPYILPPDLKAFYALFNGLQLSYRVEIGGKQVPVGEMKLNKLEGIARVALEGTFPKMTWPKSSSMSERISNHHITSVSTSALVSSSNPNYNDAFVLDIKTSAAFSIDSSLQIGDVVLLYRSPDNTHGHGGAATGNSKWKSAINPYEEPEVWFQDISARWHFICPTFTHFLRLMVSHLGIYGWHLAYTQEGLPPETIHWMGLFCKERICVDLSQAQRN
jgi:hypothetical protein